MKRRRTPALRRTSRLSVLACLALVVATGACAALPGGGSSTLPADPLLPPGYGTLLQDELTLTVRKGALQLKATPLEEWMIRLAAPDTYDRLSELAAAHRAALVRDSGVPDPVLFLVSVFSDEVGTTYEPEDLRFAERGRRFRPLAIRPVTSGWGTQRLPQRETRMAIYAFDSALGLDMGTVLEYDDVRNRQWDVVLQRLQSEHARARARAGL